MVCPMHCRTLSLTSVAACNAGACMFSALPLACMPLAALPRVTLPLVRVTYPCPCPGVCACTEVCSGLAAGAYPDPEDLFAAVASHCEQSLACFQASSSEEARQMGGRRLRQLPTLVHAFVAGAWPGRGPCRMSESGALMDQAPSNKRRSEWVHTRHLVSRVPVLSRTTILAPSQLMLPALCCPEAVVDVCEEVMEQRLADELDCATDPAGAAGG